MFLALPAAALALGALQAGGGSAAPGGGQLWVTVQDASRIQVIHGDGDAVDTIQLPNGTSPHFARLSPSDDYVYVPSLGYGTVTVIRTRDRHVFDPLLIAPATPPALNSNPALPGGLGTHDAKPSPDGSVVLAAQWSNNSIYRIAADESAETWSVDGSVPLPDARRPICIVFHPDGDRAYVGTVPTAASPPGTTPAIGVVNIAPLEVTGLQPDVIMPVVGAWSCSWAQTHDGSTMWLTTNAPGGRVYLLDMTRDKIGEYLQTGAPHIHGLGMSPDEKTLYLSSRNEDRLQIVDIASKTVDNLELGSPEVADRPDSVAVQGAHVWVTLKSTGKLARVNASDQSIEYVDLELPCPGVDALGTPLPPPEDAQLCYAVHSVDGGN
jgi:sugar lactone lactonase YvrE